MQICFYCTSNINNVAFCKNSWQVKAAKNTIVDVWRDPKYVSDCVFSMNLSLQIKSINHLIDKFQLKTSELRVEEEQTINELIHTV